MQKNIAKRSGNVNSCNKYHILETVQKLYTKEITLHKIICKESHKVRP